MNAILPTNLPMKLKQVLKAQLDKHDMTVVQLSRKASVPKNTLFNWLAGMKPKDVEQAKRCADVFGVSLDFLLFGTEPQQRKTTLEEHRDEINAGTFEVILRPTKKGVQPK